MEFARKIAAILEDLDDRTRYLIFGGLLLLAFLLDYFLLMKPQINALSKINPEIKILAKDTKKTKEDIKRIDEYKKEVESLRQQMVEINYLLRSKEEVPLILEEITVKASDNGIMIDQIMPYPQDQKQLLKSKKRKYYALPILLDARATYHDIGRFLNEIENENTFTTIDTFSISEGKNFRQHRLKLTLETIVYVEGSK